MTLTKTSAKLLCVALLCTVGIAFSMPQEVSAASKKPGKVKSVTVSNKGTTKLKIKWKKTKYAKKYKVYRSTDKKKYTPIKTVKATKKKTQSFTDSKLQSGTTYYYKVRALRGSKKGKASSSKTGYTTPAKVSLDTPELKTDTEKKEYNIVLSFKVSSGKASGYTIYRKSGDGDFKKLGSTSKTTYTDKTFTPSEVQSYYVVAYKKASKKTLTGKASATVTADPTVAEDGHTHNFTTETTWKQVKTVKTNISGTICMDCVVEWLKENYPEYVGQQKVGEIHYGDGTVKDVYGPYVKGGVINTAEKLPGGKEFIRDKANMVKYGIEEAKLRGEKMKELYGPYGDIDPATGTSCSYLVAQNLNFEKYDKDFYERFDAVCDLVKVEEEHPYKHSGGQTEDSYDYTVNADYPVYKQVEEYTCSDCGLTFTK